MRNGPTFGGRGLGLQCEMPGFIQLILGAVAGPLLEKHILGGIMWILFLKKGFSINQWMGLLKKSAMPAKFLHTSSFGGV